MADTEYLIKEDAYPFDEARRFIKRVRRASFHLFVDIDVPSDEEGKVYPMRESVQVSARQMLKLIDDWEGFSARKREAGQNGCRGVRFSVTVWRDHEGVPFHHVYIG